MAGPGNLPSGVVSFVLTDIEGSTRILRAEPDRYDEVIDLHNAALRQAWAAHHGYELGTEGDSFLVAFAEASEAVAAAAEAQRAMVAVNWPVPLPVRIRIGVHTGYAQPRDDDYRALVVHQTARVAAAAHGGQVLVTDDTARRLRGPPQHAHLEAAGRFRVRDFDGPVLLHLLVVDDVPRVDTALRVRPADGHNIVAPSTPLVGRQDDVRAVSAMVAPGAVVTVVGPGGVGKTRLAVEVALRVSDGWRDGVWFVDLAPLTSDSSVVTAIAAAVGAAVTNEADPLEELCDFLSDRRMLVLLDNCEHLVERVNAVVVRLTERTSDVGVLATSRVPLGLRVEKAYRLGPLPGESGVQLFVQHAAATAPLDMPTVAALVDELDGLPLAIELAAARTVTLPPADILARLRSTTSVLSSTDPALPERQRSLNRLLDWSVALLPPPARVVLTRFGSFADGFDLDTAELLGAGDDWPVSQIAELLWTLLDHSLVVSEVGAGDTRFRLPATVRSYIRDRTTQQEVLATAHRLALIYLDRLGPRRPDDAEWVGAMELEMNNVRQVTRTLAGRDDDVAQQLAWSIGRLHDVKDAYRVGIDETAGWCRLLRSPTPSRVALLTMLADLHLRVAEVEQAAAVMEDAERLANTVGVPAWADAAVARASGEVALRRGELATARTIAEKSLATTTTPRGRARLWNLVGLTRFMSGDLPGAVSAFEEELAAATLAGVDSFTATTHGNLAEAYLHLGDLGAAAVHQREALDLARAQRQTVLVAFSMMVAARISPELGRPAKISVVLQAVADRLLDSAGYALYAEDVEQRAALLRAAEAKLRGPAFRRALAEASAMDTEEAANLADVILEEAASLTAREKREPASATADHVPARGGPHETAT